MQIKNSNLTECKFIKNVNLVFSTYKFKKVTLDKSYKMSINQNINAMDLPLKIFVKESNHSKELTTKKVVNNLGFQGLEAKTAYEETIGQDFGQKPDKNNQISKRIVRRKKRKTEDCSNNQITSKNFSVNSIFKAIESNDLKFLQINLHTDNVNISDGFGWTPLMSAAFAGNVEIVDFLLKLGAKKNIKDKSGLTAAGLALKNKFTNVVSLLEKSVQNTGFQNITTESISKTYENSSSIEETSSPKKINSLNEKTNVYCNLCNAEFKNTTRIKHESSIVHIFNTKPKVPGAHYIVPKGSKGYQMLVNSGWNEEQGLGPSGEGRKYPVKTTLKQDRKGLGSEEKNIARVTHFKPRDSKAIKTKRAPNERTLKKWERENHLQRESRREKALRRALS